MHEKKKRPNNNAREYEGRKKSRLKGIKRATSSQKKEGSFKRGKQIRHVKRNGDKCKSENRQQTGSQGKNLSNNKSLGELPGGQGSKGAKEERASPQKTDTVRTTLNHACQDRGEKKESGKTTRRGKISTTVAEVLILAQSWTLFGGTKRKRQSSKKKKRATTVLGGSSAPGTIARQSDGAKAWPPQNE